MVVTDENGNEITIKNKISTDEFNGLLTDIHACLDATQRFGQKVMNAYARLKPREYQLITGSDVDCFYNDTKVNKFWAATVSDEVKSYLNLRSNADTIG